MKREMTLAEIEKEPGKALGQLSRRRGQINKLTVKLAKAEKLAETRLHGRG